VSPAATGTTLYFDLASPYAYLAFERAESVLGVVPELEPVLVGAIFQWRGRGSWGLSDQRAPGMKEIEQRARRYGLPPVRWPAKWPANSLAAMRAALWAKHRGRARDFAHHVFEREFAEGADITDVQLLSHCAQAAGLDEQAMLAAVGDQAIKDELKRVTERAWAEGVRGVPSVGVGGQIIFGDDQLERAAQLLVR
jgi:2-hydroxychromene-2-carboxylate isomerase